MPQRRGLGVFLVLAVCCGSRRAYQQPTAEMGYCMQSGVESTVRSFWYEISRHCPQNPYRLMELYEQIVDKGVSDKCSALLRKQVRTALVETSASILEDAVISNTFVNNHETARLTKRLFQCSSVISQAVFERLVENVYLFMDKPELASQLYENSNFEQMVTSVVYLHRKVVSRADMEPRLSSRLANYMRRILLKPECSHLPHVLVQRLHSAIRGVPEALRNLYFSSTVRVLNVAHWEYLYAPRLNGPSGTQRTPLTWVEEKNSTDSDGDFTLEVDDGGNVALASEYNATLAFLYVDEAVRKPFFWLGQGVPETRWWQVSDYEDYVTLQNAVTQHLLCATSEYDENRRYVTLQKPSTRHEDSPCRWTVTPRK